MTANQWYQEGQYQKILNRKVFVRKAGSGPALVCIHGFPTSSWDFAPMAPTLEKHFAVYYTDLIGLGKSEKPPQAISVQEQASIIDTLMHEMGISQAHILAHDLGDTVAQELLAMNNEKSSKTNYQSMVFLNGGLFPEMHRILPIQKLLLSPLGPLVARLTSIRTFKKNMFRVFGTDYPPTEEFITDSWQLLADNNGRAMIPNLIRYVTERKVNRERWVGAMQQASIPLRLINGVQDPVSGIHAAEHYQKIIPLPDVVLLEKAGHYPHVETPQLVLHAFLAFHQTLDIPQN